MKIIKYLKLFWMNKISNILIKSKSYSSFERIKLLKEYLITDLLFLRIMKNHENSST